tara:strand:- start:1129 stop:1611 length:483 start_codon:yes stop_codon:yes gene_type:complete
MESKFKIFAELITKIVNSIHKELGAGFAEDVYQNALAIELRKYEINYLKEMSFEIFYKKNSVGLARLDFFVKDKKLPNFIIETKSLQCLNDSARTQLSRYLLSSQLNTDSELRKTKYGVLINWPGSTVDTDTQMLTNKNPEVEFYVLKNEKIQKIEMENK